MTLADAGTGHGHGHGHDHGHGHGHDHGPDDVAAWVADRPVTVAEVRRREAALRAGEFASRLPVRRSPQGRNVVRWIVQLMATEQLVRAEAEARGLDVDGTGRRRALDITTALELGGVLATVLASMPVASRVRDAVTADVGVDAAEARAYYEHNRDRFEELESRLIETRRSGGDPCRSRVFRGELPPAWEAAVFAVEPGTPVTVTPERVITVRELVPARLDPFEVVQARLAEQLREHARDRFFGDWVHLRRRSLVRLATGYEHPGDPHHADATHRH